MKIGLLVGSLRKGSFNRKIAELSKKIIDEGNEAEIIDISYLPFYNQDDDGANPKEEYTRIREELRKYDGYIFFTPEYNRSLAPVLKNVIDIGSRDPKGNLWDGKVAAVFSASMGSTGGAMGNHALRQSFVYINLITMNQPEVYIPAIHTLFDEEGNLIDGTRTFVEDSTRAFVDFAKKHS
ncbi:MAG: NAD(P)H-dependent oxidoreductase [Anaerococcus sp.]|uniref:NADPH-dependent FMN reductase n=1 Tax=Anaerococcus sp. TaxID=1872515 RepID=UPI0026158BB6|nr:NAD(P)H-dependent oxidoreductase [Anaerococcus sp.]MCI5972075.1 NAD(P)H-dependent oxidoreductase [Anaerococcus sp.]MDD6918152.1 NAD(P)H-dependent oxidoreductase [Peptoniphilaceae bacterium]MDY2928045.1 NAD(P)H-dependent oxidoreductase [Anaerococcus sp.]